MELDGTNIKFYSSELRADKEIVLAAIKTFPEALCSTSKELRDDKYIVLASFGVDFANRIW